MEVLTHYGLGTVRDWTGIGPMEVHLRASFHGEKTVKLPREKAFCWSSYGYGVVRLITGLKDNGILANIQFNESRHAIEPMVPTPPPSNETGIFFSLTNGLLNIKGEAGNFSDFNPIVTVGVRIDKWAAGRVKKFYAHAEALKEFEAARKKAANAPEGIMAHLLLDLERKKVLWIFIATTRGIAWERSFLAPTKRRHD